MSNITSNPVNPQPIWQVTLDQGMFKAEVSAYQDNNYLGLLTLENSEGENLFSKEVSISYGAPMGPDALDVNEWVNQAITWIDGN